jgi:glycosyltransferase involved in cell wall biosynthesis
MRVLLITSRFPLPPWRGNQMRTVEWLQALEDCDRVLVAPAPPRAEAGRMDLDSSVVHHPYRPTLPARGAGVVAAWAAGRPLQEGLYGVAAARRSLDRALEDDPPDVAVVQMMRCGWALDRIHSLRPELPVVFDAIDAMGLHYQRTAPACPLPLRPLWRLEAGRCQRREQHMIRLARVTTAVAWRDLEALGPPRDRARMVPVAAGERPGRQGPPADPMVLLSGNLGYRPTVHGALWFAARVWPLVREQVPGARWVLAGARPARAVRRLARVAGVEVHGDVPELDSYLAAASVAIAPMATGSGVPVKVLEAWAAGVPVVADPWAASGLAAEPAPGVEVAEQPREWAEAVVRLLTRAEAAQELAARGREVWQRFYHPDRVSEAIRDAVMSAAGSE